MPPHLPASLTVYGERVTLRDWIITDAPALEPACGDWDICTFSTVPWDFSHEAAAAWIDHWQPLRATGRAVGLAIVDDDRESELPIGHVNLVRFDDEARSAALGYWIAPSERGRGGESALGHGHLRAVTDSATDRG